MTTPPMLEHDEAVMREVLAQEWERIERHEKGFYVRNPQYTRATANTDIALAAMRTYADLRMKDARGAADWTVERDKFDAWVKSKHYSQAYLALPAMWDAWEARATLPTAGVEVTEEMVERAWGALFHGVDYPEDLTASHMRLALQAALTPSKTGGAG